MTNETMAWVQIIAPGLGTIVLTWFGWRTSRAEKAREKADEDRKAAEFAQKSREEAMSTKLDDLRDTVNSLSGAVNATFAEIRAKLQEQSQQIESVKREGEIGRESRGKLHGRLDSFKSDVEQRLARAEVRLEGRAG